jgi:hypothetical protein
MEWQTVRWTLGIHSCALNASPHETDNYGHAWISISDSENGETTTFGLWPDGHPFIPLSQRQGWDGSGTNVRQGMEDFLEALASRYYTLSSEQELALRVCLSQPAYWTHGNNCSRWAVKTVEAVAGERVARRDWRLGFAVQTPSSLSDRIVALEQDSPTTEMNPLEADTEREPEQSTTITSTFEL